MKDISSKSAQHKRFPRNCPGGMTPAGKISDEKETGTSRTLNIPPRYVSTDFITHDTSLLGSAKSGGRNALRALLPGLSRERLGRFEESMISPSCAEQFRDRSQRARTTHKPFPRTTLFRPIHEIAWVAACHVACALQDANGGSVLTRTYACWVDNMLRCSTAVPTRSSAKRTSISLYHVQLTTRFAGLTAGRSYFSSSNTTI